MKFLGIDLGPSKQELLQQNIQLEQQVNEAFNMAHEARAMMSAMPLIPDTAVYLPQYRWTPFNGEKNDGALGPILNLVPDYYGFAQRAWTVYGTSDIGKTVIDKYTTWVIDQGLSLKANPAKLVLESEGISMDSVSREKFNDIVEARFGVWSKSNHSSYSGEKNLKQIAKDAFLNAKIGGDVLTVLRYVNGTVKVQLIDGRRICSPGNIAEIGDGNIVTNGIEMTPEGTHVKYWIRGKAGEPTAIPAMSDTGLRTAFLVKGSKWTLDFHRGLPVIAVVMEAITKLDRYKEAVVANAEEIAKVVMQFVHGVRSQGEDPLSAKGVVARLQRGPGQQTLPVDEFSEQLSKKVSSTLQKMVINMPVDSEIKTVPASSAIRDFDKFHTAVVHIICAAVGIPPNVAQSLYTDSYSASRAATKDWDHTIDVERDDFTDQFYMHIYRFWLFTEIMNGKVNAPGFIKAFASNNFMVTDSYTSARFTGPHFPHVDPLTEVEAERLKLGSTGGAIPLGTVEQATENLGGGDSDSNMEQFAEEKKKAEKLGLKEQEQPAPVITQ